MTEGASATQASLIVYPCVFPIKVMGAATEEFAATMAEVARRHDPGFDAGTSLELRASRGGRYQSATLNITATSRAQLDALYRELTAHPMVKMVL